MCFTKNQGTEKINWEKTIKNHVEKYIKESYLDTVFGVNRMDQCPDTWTTEFRGKYF